MSKTVGHAADREFKRDLEIIARGQPGRGAALQRLIARAGVTQVQIADHLGCDRTSVSHWVREERWPRAQTIVDLLSFLRVDQAMLQEAAAILLGGDISADVLRKCGGLKTFKVTPQEFLDILQTEDDFAQRDSIFKVFVPQALVAVGFRAAGLKGGEACDPRAVKILLEEYREHLKDVSTRETRSPRTIPEWQRRAIAETFGGIPATSTPPHDVADETVD